MESVKPLENGANIRLYRLASDQWYDFVYRGQNLFPLSLDSVLPRRVQRDRPALITVSGLGIPQDPAVLELSVGETTVKAHVSAILRKLKVFSRTQAVIKARKLEFENILADDD